jgi:hypothetical protein
LDGKRDWLAHFEPYSAEWARLLFVVGFHDVFRGGVFDCAVDFAESASHADFFVYDDSLHYLCLVLCSFGERGQVSIEI